MMKYILFCLFLILILPNFWVLMYFLMILSFLFMYSCINYNYFYMISGYFSVDLISYSLISLTSWIIFLMILASYNTYMTNNYVSEFLFTILFLYISLIFAFSVDNLFLFYLCFEMSIIPTLFLIFGWGYQPERLIAGYYLLFYTLFASLPLLISLFYIFSFSFTLNFMMIDLYLNLYLYISLIFAFLVSIPMMFVHFWLPKAHVEAPISGSMILAAILLKLGAYGLYRVFILGYDYFVLYNYMFLMLGLFSSFVVGLLCLCQVDIKSLIAYSSVAHMGLVILGIMTCNYYGLIGSFILVLGHAFCSSALFCLANILYERTLSRSLYINKGFMTFFPSLSMLLFLLCSNNMAAPPSLNLLGEIYIINSLMGWNYLFFILLMLGSFFACCYSIYLYSLVNHGFFYKGFIILSPITIREYLLIIFHWLPLNLLIVNFDSFTMFL
nr:NADH dehydrogenase subunit 4 [Megacopta bituminata]